MNVFFVVTVLVLSSSRVIRLQVSHAYIERNGMAGGVGKVEP